MEQHKTDKDEAKKTEAESKVERGLLWDALTYPFRGDGWITLLIGTVMLALLGAGSFAPLIGFFAALFLGGYYSAYFFSMVNATMVGEDEAPDMPSFSNWSTDILLPWLQMLGVYMISLLPIILLSFLGDKQAFWYEPAILGAVLYAALYLPVAVIALLALGSMWDTLPHVVLPAIVRALPKILLPSIALALFVLATYAVDEWLQDWSVINWVLSALITFYGAMVEARLIGLTYHAARDRLGWG